jgi:hypothetical protein
MESLNKKTEEVAAVEPVAAEEEKPAEEAVE